MRHHEAGLSKILILIIIGLGVLTASGVSLQNYVQPEALKNKAENTREQAVQTYRGELRQPLKQYVLDPAEVIWRYTESGFLITIRTFLESLVESEAADKPTTRLFEPKLATF